MEKAMREANESFYYNILTYLQLLTELQQNKLQTMMSCDINTRHAYLCYAPPGLPP